MLHYAYIAYHVSNMITEVCNIIFIVVSTTLVDVSDVFELSQQIFSGSTNG